MQLVSRLVAHIVKVIVNQSVARLAYRRKSQIRSVLIVTMVVRIVVVLRCLSLIRRIVAAIASSSAVELPVMRLSGVRLDLIVEHLLVLVRVESATASLRLRMVMRLISQ